MKKKIIYLILSCLLVVSLVAVSCGSEPAEDETTVTTPAAEVQTPPAEPMTPPEEEPAAEEVAVEEPQEEEQPPEEPVTLPEEEIQVVVEEEAAPVVEEEEPVVEEVVEEEVEEEAPPEVIIMAITSTAFQEGESIPRQYSCDGLDMSPELSWSGVPEGTLSFVIILDDPDAPGGTWNHWVIFNIPADTRELGEAVPKTSQLDSGALQGRNSFVRIGYGGPCPPSGEHRYYFTIYALDITLDLSAGASKTQVLNAMQDHILAQAVIMGTYRR